MGQIKKIAVKNNLVTPLKIKKSVVMNISGKSTQTKIPTTDVKG